VPEPIPKPAGADDPVHEYRSRHILRGIRRRGFCREPARCAMSGRAFAVPAPALGSQMRDDCFGVLAPKPERRRRRIPPAPGRTLSRREQCDLVLVEEARQPGDRRRLHRPACAMENRPNPERNTTSVRKTPGKSEGARWPGACTTVRTMAPARPPERDES